MKRIEVDYIDMGGPIVGNYRYVLCRKWWSERNRVVYVMLNPSTADAVEDDTTIKQCVHFAARDGFGSISVVNLFAYRATDPKQLRDLKNKSLAIGPLNARHIHDEVLRADKLVLAWGEKSKTYQRHLDSDVRKLCSEYDVYCLGTTKDGHPRHPSRLALDTPFEPYEYPF